MFERAKKFFQGYIKDPAKHGYVDWSVNEVQEIKNVWTWLPDDISQWTIIRSPIDPMPQAEAIWIMYENWNHETITRTWFCKESTELDDFILTIRAKGL
tara:strand:- start:114 stop:410 length:297 start_codon:yes stop_codon:yes gene_type:complete